MLRIYADFNNNDERGRVRLGTATTLQGENVQIDELKDGLRVTFYMIGEFEVEGILVFDRTWLGIPDWSTIKYTPPNGTTT